MAEKLNALAAGYAAGMVSALCMLVLSVLAGFGFYAGAANMMVQWHMFYSLSPLGIVAGMAEAAVIGFALFYAGALVYNRFA